MSIESYIIIRKPDRRGSKFAVGAGELSTLEKVALFRYPNIDDVIDISDYYMDSSIGTWHENIDEEIFTRFDSGDVSITLSILGGEYPGVRNPTSELFYAKLYSNDLYRRLHNWMYADSVIDKMEQWELSIFIPETSSAFWGVIDKKSVYIDEGRGTVSFSAYDGMKYLERIPVSAATYEDSGVYKWKRVIKPSEAFEWVWNGGAFKAREFLPQFEYNILTGATIDFTGWMLSFEDLPEDYTDRRVVDFRWDGSYLWVLCEGGTDYKISIAGDESWTWNEVDELAENGNFAFAKWEAQTPVSSEPPPASTYYTELARAEDIAGAAGYYDYDSHYLYTIERVRFGFDIGLTELLIKKQLFSGYDLSGVPQWGAHILVDSRSLMNTDIIDNYLDIAVNPTSGNVYYTIGRRICLYDGISHTDVDYDTGDNYAFKNLNYLYGLTRLINEQRQGDEFYSLQIRDRDGVLIASRRGEIPKINDYSNYNLDWQDIDIKSLFEVQIDDFTGVGTGLNTYIAGYTKKAPIRFFLLDSTFSRCVYYTNLEQAIGMNLGSKCHITRRLKAETIDTGTGTTTIYRNYIHGYIGDGSIRNGVFFSYRMGSTGNIRILNCEDMNMASFMSGLATFSNSYFFIRNWTRRDSLDRNIAYPEINLINRNEYDSSISVWYLDNEWTDFKVKPLYENLKGVVNVKFNGGEIKVGADKEIDIGLESEYMDLSYFAGAVDSLSINCPFVFDLNYARFIGCRALSFLWIARQLWEVEARMQYNPYRILDRVWMHAIDSSMIPKQGIVIAIDYDPLEGKSAKLRIITAGENDIYYPPNPIINPPPIYQVGQIPEISS